MHRANPTQAAAGSIKTPSTLNIDAVPTKAQHHCWQTWPWWGWARRAWFCQAGGTTISASSPRSHADPAGFPRLLRARGLCAPGELPCINGRPWL